QVGKLSMHLLHDGIPMPTRRAVVGGNVASPMPQNAHGRGGPAANVRETLLKTLAHPNVASKHWIIRQYDHEVQGGSVIKPLVGPRQVGPSDASVVWPKLGSHKAVALGCGMAPHI